MARSRHQLHTFHWCGTQPMFQT
eukprot:SAG31_NODE_44295_length_263_cov_0.926829_1_plen_22_part_10